MVVGLEEMDFGGKSGWAVEGDKLGEETAEDQQIWPRFGLGDDGEESGRGDGLRATAMIMPVAELNG